MKKICKVLIAAILILSVCAVAMAEAAVPAAEETMSVLKAVEMIDLTGIIKAAILLIMAIIAKKVIPLIDAKLTNEQKMFARAAVKTMVFAAEQIYGAGGGAQKLDFVAEQLKKQGFTVDRVEIEAAVGEYINNWPEIEQAVEIEDVIEAEAEK